MQYTEPSTEDHGVGRGFEGLLVLQFHPCRLRKMKDSGFQTAGPKLLFINTSLELFSSPIVTVYWAFINPLSCTIYLTESSQCFISIHILPAKKLRLGGKLLFDDKKEST